ncbi:MAG TPA: ATP-binding protein [Patescibacteria group bacterium]|nr:ATP-binding protein [Patescibacteria group bacterium]
MKSIKAQLMLAVTVIVGIGLGCVMLTLYLSNDQLIRTNLEDKFLKQSQILANGFDIHMQREKTVITSFMKQAQPQYYELAGDIGKAQQFVIKMHLDFPQWNPVTFFPDTTGKTAITSLIGVVDASKLEYVSSFHLGRPYFSDPIISIVHGAPIVVGVAPIVVNDKVVGAVTGGMHLNIFTRDIAATKIGEQGFCILVSPNGTITSHPNPDFVLKKKLADLGNPALVEAFHRMKGNLSGTLITEINGQPHLIAYTPTLDGWGIFVASPTAVEFAVITRLGWMFLALFVAGWLLTIQVMNRILSYRFTGPVAQLAASMRRWPQTTPGANDDPQASLPPLDPLAVEHWPQELQALHMSYQSMAAQIRQQLAAILAVTEKYTKAFRHSSDVIGLVRSRDQCIIELSDAFFSTFSYTRDEVLQHSSEEFGLWTNPAQRQNMFQALYRGEKVQRLETPWRTRSGEIRLGLLSVELIKTEEEEYNLFLWQDITELKRSEQALLQMNADLEEKVELRTRELYSANMELTAMNEQMIAMNETLEYANEKLKEEVAERRRAEENLSESNRQLQFTLEQLRQAQAKMIEAEKISSLGSLVTGIAHEINTPLGNCVTLASHLHLALQNLSLETGKEIPETTHSQQYRDYIEDSREILPVLVTNLSQTGELIRSFRNVATSQIQEDRQYFYVAPYLDQVFMALQPSLRKARLQWRIDCPATLRWDSYPGALSQIVTHLVMNSIMHGYAPEEAGTIECSLLESDDEIIMEYRDDGRGMTPEVLSKAFDPFFTTNRSTGSGLGLYTVYNLVTQKLSGSITCTSSPGAGTVFVLHAPRLQKKPYDLPH